MTTNDRDVIIEASEEKEEKDKKRPFSYSYYHRSSMPENTDFGSVKAVLNDKEVSINASLIEGFKPKSRQIPLEHSSKHAAVEEKK